MESKVLKCLINSRESFNNIAPYIKQEEFSEPGRIVYKIVEDFYYRDPEMESVDQEILLKFIENKYPNKIDLFEHLIDNMPESVSAPNILEYYRELKRERLGERIASSLLGSQTKKAIAYMEDYLSLSVEAFTEETTLHDLDAEELLKKTHGTDLIPLYPSILSDKLGGGMPRQGQLLIYARPDAGKSTVAMNIAGGATKEGYKVLYCYAKNTEVLTPSGWVRFEDLTTNSYVAQVTDGMQAEFVKPIQFIQRHYKGPMVKLRLPNGRVKLDVIPEHTMVTTYKGKLRHSMIKDTKYYQGIKHHTSAPLLEDELNINSELTLLERLQIAYQADGSRTSARKVRFFLKKKRKIDRLRHLLDSLGIEYTVVVREKGVKKGYTDIRFVEHNALRKDFTWVNLRAKSSKWCKQFIQELQRWDGHKRKDRNSIIYSTTTEQCKDMVQAICALGGYESNIHKAVDNRSSSFSACYYINIRLGEFPTDGGALYKEEYPYDDNIYCVSVPSGKLLVRYKDTVSVSGNCGNEDPSSVMVPRYLSRATGWTRSDVYANLQGAIDEARKVGAYQNFLFHPMSPGSIQEIRVQIEKHKPDIVILDQIRSVITGAEGHTLNMERVCIEMRALAKEHNFVSILVTQAGESAHNKLILDMTDVEWSSTGIQGTMDLMIGIGQDRQWKEMNRIMISTPKNKLTEPIKPFDCRIDYATQTIFGKRE